MILSSKKIMVIGASRGIGEAIALACAAEGADLVLTGRNADTLTAVCDKLKEYPVKTSTLVWDVSDVAKAPDMMAAAAAAMGGLDVVIHNAGVVDHEKFLAVTEEGWDRVFDINVKGAFFSIQAAVNYFLDNNDREVKGKIVVISSETGHQPHPTPYGMSKWSVMGMCQGMAKKLFKLGVVISNIAPGPVTTEMMNWSEGKSDAWPSAFGRMAYPNEIADLAVFLASDKSNRIAGQPIYINGGLNC